MTHPTTPEQMLTRAQRLISTLLDQHTESEPKAVGPTHLRNMLKHVENIEARVVKSDENPTNAIKRLRDFSNIIERLSTRSDITGMAGDTCHELVSLLRSAADALTTNFAQSVAA